MRRNIYDDKGKDVTPADGEGSTTTALEGSLSKDVKQTFCYSCGKDCTRVRYHNSKNPPATATTPKPSKEQRYDLCSICFQEGRFPSSTTAADYVKLENASYRSLGDKDSPWSDSELLLLLEALELFDDNWESVADHVGTRTREECVLRFLQLEIEDPYLDSQPQQSQRAQQSTTNTSHDLTYLSGGRLPFSNYDNPVLSVLAFLASLADPVTTAQAAGKSIDVLRKNLRQQIEPSTAGASTTETNTITTSTTTTTTTSDPAPPFKPEPPSDSTPTDIPATLLTLTATRSAALASHTERHLTSQISAAVNLQLSKLETKMQQFEQMEALLRAERREVERERLGLFLERVEFRRRVAAAEAGKGGAEEGMLGVVGAEVEGGMEGLLGEGVRHEI